MVTFKNLNFVDVHNNIQSALCSGSNNAPRGTVYWICRYWVCIFNMDAIYGALQIKYLHWRVCVLQPEGVVLVMQRLVRTTTPFTTLCICACSPCWRNTRELEQRSCNNNHSLAPCRSNIILHNTLV